MQWKKLIVDNKEKGGDNGAAKIKSERRYSLQLFPLLGTNFFTHIMFANFFFFPIR